MERVFLVRETNYPLVGINARSSGKIGGIRILDANLLGLGWIDLRSEESSRIVLFFSLLSQGRIMVVVLFAVGCPSGDKEIRGRGFAAASFGSSGYTSFCPSSTHWLHLSVFVFGSFKLRQSPFMAQCSHFGLEYIRVELFEKMLEFIA